MDIEERVAALDEWAVEQGLRHSAHEFVLEVMLAHRFLAMSDDHASRFAEDLASPMREAWTKQDHLTEADMRAASERLSAHVEALAQKALARSRRLRAAE